MTHKGRLLGFLINILVGFSLDTFFHVKAVSNLVLFVLVKKCELRSCSTLQQALEVVNAQCPTKLKALEFETLSQATTMPCLGSQCEFHFCCLLQTSHMQIKTRTL